MSTKLESKMFEYGRNTEVFCTHTNVRKERVKQETSLDRNQKISVCAKIISDRDIGFGRLKATERTSRGRENDIQGASPALYPSVRQWRGDIIDEGKTSTNLSSGIGITTSHKIGVGLQPKTVPVLAPDGQPLMPTNPSRARRWVDSRKATPFIVNGIWCVRLIKEPSGRCIQKMVLGIDPGSKFEGFSLISKGRTHLNLQSEAITHVKDSIEVRRNMRHTRRFRKTPCRPNRLNRKKGGIPPSTRARWGAKLRIIDWMRKIYPITDVHVEDIAAKTHKGARRWNVSFSPLEVGKKWFYEQIEAGGLILKTYQGYETKQLRDNLGLSKSKNKAEKSFNAHCVDAWVLANDGFDSTSVDYQRVRYIKSIRFHRRQLHAFQPAKKGVRRPYGGTMTFGLKRGSIVKSPKFGITYLGGTSKGNISLHSITTGKRITQNQKITGLRVLAHNKYTTLLPRLKTRVSVSAKERQ